MKYLLLLLLLVPPYVQAHTGGSAFLDLARIEGNRLQATWDVDLRDLQVALDLDADRDGALTWREVQQDRERIAAHLQGGVRLSVADAACLPSNARLPGLAEHGEIDLLRVTMDYACAAGRLDVDATGAVSADPSLRILLTVEAEDTRSRAVALSASSPRWRQGTAHLAIAARFLFEGVRHLLTGYDHLAFLAVLLIGLVMPRRGDVSRPAAPTGPLWRSVLRIVTAFTLAHSLTLALAATGVARLPAAPVEAAIAASIIAAALFNLAPGMHRYGWQLALGFGLVHGFGFASALSAMVSQVDLLALAAFNLGIEAAQLACAALLLPLLYQATRSSVAGRHVASAASVGVALLAGWWLCQRLTFA
jgi:hypothetical protein